MCVCILCIYMHAYLCNIYMFLCVCMYMCVCDVHTHICLTLKHYFEWGRNSTHNTMLPIIHNASA